MTTTVLAEDSVDHKGLLYHLGSAGDTRAFYNPHFSGDAWLTCSSSVWNGNTPVWNLSDRTASNFQSLQTGADTNWWQVDVDPCGKGRRLKPTKAHIEQGGGGTLRDVDVLASNDGITWTRLCDANTIATSGWVSLDVSSTLTFRYFRVLQTNINYTFGTWVMMAGSFELFGTLYE